MALPGPFPPDAGLQARIFAEFEINPGKTLGIPSDGFKFESNGGEDGRAYITLVVPTTRAQIERILRGN
jgi:hypothetical protein